MIRIFSIRFLLTIAVLAAVVPLRADLDDILNFTPKSAKNKDASHRQSAAGITSVVAEDLTLTQKELLDDLLTQLVSKFKPAGRLEIEALQTWQDLDLPSSRWETEIYQYPAKALQDRFTIAFKLFSGGEHIGSWQLPVVASLWQDAYITKRQVNAGARLNRADFSMQELDSLRLQKGLMPAKTLLDNFEARSTLSVNKPLFLHDVKGRTLVVAGERVMAIAKRGSLEITMSAKSLEDGALGDTIVLRNLESDKRIEGKVIDEAKVQVNF